MLFPFFAVFILSEPSDPLYPLQFNINNHGQYFGINGEDVRLDDKNDGSGVTITVIDDGCYHEHVELSPNFDLDNSFNYKTFQKDPFEKGFNHGTAFAGIAAGASNQFCGVGVAPKATLRCFNLNSNYSKANLIDSIKRNNDKNTPQIKVFGTPFKCEGNICNHYSDSDIEKAITDAPDNIIFIASAGSDAALGGDSNFHPLLQHPRVIVVADTNNRGARSAWTNRGSNILVSAPAGGSSSLVDITFPSLPVPTADSTQSCTNSSDPVGAGAATVAGVVALILQENPKLTWREVNNIFALSSKITDFNHPSWTANGAKNPLYYSHVYGFGGVSESLAAKIVNLKWPAQVSETAVNDTKSIIPVMRGGFINKTLKVEGNQVKMIEYVVLTVALTNVDYSTVRIQLISPRGTVSNVKFYSVSNSRDGVYKYTIRNSFGASPKGDWIIHLVNDGIGESGEFVNATLTVYGSKSEIALPHFQEKGTNPYATPESINATVKIETTSDEIVCGSKINITISGTDLPLLFTMTDSEKRSRWPILSKMIARNELTDFRLPCYFSNNESMIIYAENQEAGIWGESSPLKVQNNKADYVLLYPNPYKTYFIEDDKNLTIVIVPTMNLEYWIDGGAAQRALVTLYDLDNKTSIFRKNVVLSSTTQVEVENPVRCEKCILSVVLSWHYPFSDCQQMIQPISILQKGDVPGEPFAVPLNSACPIPEGIKINDQIPSASPTPAPKSKMLPMIIGIVFLVLFVSFIIVFFLINTRNHDNSTINTYLLK
ncbi:Clan SB, family S8, subtilisin-like serine peptidase [Tritrichomonas foetus]|uniref:Clan SB, family S8, subtilisin-like serine peptidase n=1 Tax=Tritrichomonas foetus TaxID=1144522 RepID=A0A1J4K5F1_9EUKA|nr:Clan SB, family S8, subtilisin-like serine peptidase [Tritrichomonas foetus]|eukprot:OHT04948.1 Clan SB, family S8, subtilisin-like serine peptidase [Tritrichomonas foetus]